MDRSGPQPELVLAQIGLDGCPEGPALAALSSLAAEGGTLSPGRHFGIGGHANADIYPQSLRAWRMVAGWAAPRHRARFAVDQAVYAVGSPGPELSGRHRPQRSAGLSRSLHCSGCSRNGSAGRRSPR